MYKAQQRSVANVVQNYIDVSSRRKVVVSTDEAVAAVRYALDRCEHTDRELADLIASMAIRAGCNVEFDLGQRADLRRLPQPPHRSADRKTASAIQMMCHAGSGSVQAGLNRWRFGPRVTAPET